MRHGPTAGGARRASAAAAATAGGARSPAAKVQATDDETDHWQQIQSEWEQHREKIRERIDGTKSADLESAEWAASNAIDEAKYSMLDAILACKHASVLADTYSARLS